MAKLGNLLNARVKNCSEIGAISRCSSLIFLSEVTKQGHSEAVTTSERQHVRKRRRDRDERLKLVEGAEERLPVLHGYRDIVAQYADPSQVSALRGGLDRQGTGVRSCAAKKTG
jgi:hypothetical protein